MINRPFTVYIGYDPRDAQAFEVAKKSLLLRSSIPLNIVKLDDFSLRKKGVYVRSYYTKHDYETNTLQKYDDQDHQPFSTDFSFLRFAVPVLESHRDEWVLFTDPDVLWRADIAEMLAEADRSKAVCCVHHVHEPLEKHKMDGVRQTLYHRKNWSSVMLINPARCKMLDRKTLNEATGRWLHAMIWAGSDEQIGSLSEKWNWLCGHSSDSIDAALVHFTRGTPDMEGHENEPYADEWRDMHKKVLRAA